MTDHNHTADVLLLASVLEKLRTHDGLTIARLQQNRTGIAAPLLDLAVTRQFAAAQQVDLPSAAFGLISDCVRRELHGTPQVVADTIFALHLYTAEYASAGINERVIRSLYSNSLGRRRETLLINWRRLHEALGHQAGNPPSDRALRGTHEPTVLRELARQLVRRGLVRTGSRPAPVPTAAEGSGGRVVVIGGAVMDAIFRTKALPVPETSTEAYEFKLTPGGKGLMQAVAAARLGLRVSLVAAITDDRFGEEIIRHLQDHGVDTSLVKLIPGQRTPVTGVLEMELGDSIAAYWRGALHLSPADLDQRADEVAGCDALLTTFEIPRETMQHGLALAHRDPGNRPVVIVTPAQPYAGEHISQESLPRIDYLVTRSWELGRFASPSPQPAVDPDLVARNLLAFGVDTICLLSDGGCTVYSGLSHEVVNLQVIPSIYRESSASRDAFCAALAAKLLDNNRVFSTSVALWAAAAMSCATADFPLSNAMPDRSRIETLLARSPFAAG